MAPRFFSFLLIAGVCGLLAAGPSAAVAPTVLIVDGSPVPGQPGYVNIVPSFASMRADGKAVWGAAGSVFEGNGAELVVRHTRGAHLVGVPSDWGVAADGEHLAASGSGDLAFGGWLLSDGGTTSQGYALLASDALHDLTMSFRQGDPAPGLPSGTRFGSFVTDLAIDDAGGLVVKVPILETPGSSVRTDSIWFRSHYGPIRLLIKAGQTPPGAPFPIAQLGAPLINRRGEIAVFATDSSGADLIVAADSTGALRTLVREGDASPAGLAGARLRAICCGQPLHPISWTASGVAFAALLEVGVGGVGFDGDSVIVASDGTGGLRVAAREGEPIPGRPGVVWGQLDSALGNDAGQIAIHQAYTSFDKEFVLHRPDADPILVAKDGQFAPGFPTGTSLASLESDGLLFLNEAGAVSFVALAQSASGSPSRRALFVRTSSGVLTRGVATGDAVEVAPGDVRIVSDISIGSLDGAGNVLVDLFQTSPPWGASVGMATAIYAVPEPTPSWMLPIGAMMIALIDRRRR